MKNKNSRMPWVITMIGLLLVVAISTLGYQTYKATEKTTFDEFNQRQLVIAQGAAAGIELYFDRLAEEMKALSRMPEFQLLDEIPIRREIQLMFDHLKPWGVNNIAVLDANGVLRYNVIAPQIEGVDFSWRNYYQKADDEYNVFWASDMSLFGKNLLEESEGFPAFQQVLERMGSGNSGKGEYSYYKFEDSTGQYTEDKEEKLIAYAPIHIRKELWAIGVWAPKDDVRQVIRSAYLKQLLLVGLIILIILLGSSYVIIMSSRVSRSMEKKNEELQGEIADRVRAEEKITQQNEFLNNILESLPYPFYVIDANDYSIKLANPAAKMGDLSENPTCYGLTHRSSQPCGSAEHPCPLEEVKKTKKPVTVKHIHYDRYGNARNVEVHGYPIFDREGNVVQMIENCLDITERVRAENELKKYREHLEELVEERTTELIRANEELQREIAERRRLEQGLIQSEKLAAIGSLTAGIAHEIRNPLAGIRGSAEVVKRRLKSGKDITKFLEMIFGEIDRLNGVVDKFLNFARPHKSHLESTTAGEIIDKAILLINKMAKDRNITLFKQLDGKQPNIIVDVDQIQQLLLNILINGIQAMPNGGDLRIMAQDLDGKICIKISDTGCGIPSDNLERIFDPFFTTKSQGTGLGLSIAAKIVEEHKGIISVESQEGKGTTFTIELPINRKEEVKDEKEALFF